MAIAMHSHGFSENQTRTHYQTYAIPRWNWGVAVGTFLALQVLVWYLDSKSGVGPLIKPNVHTKISLFRLTKNDHYAKFKHKWSIFS
ncbi:hypothetical protein [Pediococcus acidilactici]|uniref:hypothetical protein n=1 Tax=Pediococcus acidilactici TaxID=1254 RepID=UPI003CF489C6